MMHYCRQSLLLPFMLLFVSFVLNQAFYTVAANLEEESQPNDIENIEDIPLNGRIVIPSIEAAISVRKPLLCYYGTWSVYRPGNGKFDVENIDPYVCTHVIYSFAGLGTDNRIKPLDPWNDLPENWGKNAFGRFVGLKKRNPQLKTLIAIGGWNEGSLKYSNMVASKENRKIFIDSVIDLLTKHGFDGLDLDWEYPANRGGRPQDKQNYAQLLREMRPEFSKRGWLMTAAVSAGKNAIDTAYDVTTMSLMLDFINVMAYDYHGGWEKSTGLNAPLFSRPNDSPYNNVDYSMRYWISKGASPSKLILGIGTYGRSFTLDNPSNGQIGAPANQPGQAGPYTREPGTLGYNEICESMKTNRWQQHFDAASAVPYAQLGKQWVGYDNIQSVTLKAHYVNKQQLAGAMIWSIETDDFHGICGQGNFPLLKAIRAGLDSGNTDTGSSTHTSTVDPSIPPATESPSTDATPEESSPTPSTDVPPTPPSPNQPDIDGQCTAEGSFRNPNDCTRFIRCVPNGSGFKAYEYNCPSGTVFNNDNQVCDWPANVEGCNR